MNRIFTFLKHAGEACNRVGVRVAEIALLLLMLVTTYAVIGRYVFSSPSIHAMEVSVYLLLISTWGAVGWIHKVDRHVSMEAVTAIFTGGWKRASNLISQITVLIFSTMLIWAGTVVAMESYEKNYRSASLLDFPLWMPYTAIPVGGLLLGLIALGRLTSDESSHNNIRQEL